MRLTEIGVENLLSFESLALKALPDGLSVVVGANSVGKSNLARLVCLIRDVVGRRPDQGTLTIGELDSWVRFGGPREGTAWIGIDLTEDDERTLTLTWLRSIAAAAAEAPSGSQRNPDEWRSFRSRLAAHASRGLTIESVASFFRGRLILAIDCLPPGRTGVVYEFAHSEQTYHIGVCGGGWVQPGTVVPGRFALDQMPTALYQLNLSDDFAEDASWPNLEFDHLLPTNGSPVAWSLLRSGQRDDYPLAADLARLLGLAPDQSRNPPFPHFDEPVSREYPAAERVC